MLSAPFYIFWLGIPVLLAKEPMDCAALDLRAAWESLGSITGENTTEDVVDRIFAKFCLGK